MRFVKLFGRKKDESADKSDQGQNELLTQSAEGDSVANQSVGGRIETPRICRENTEGLIKKSEEKVAEKTEEEIKKVIEDGLEKFKQVAEANGATVVVNRTNICPACSLKANAEDLFKMVCDDSGDPPSDMDAFVVGLLMGSCYTMDALGIEHHHERYSIFNRIKLDS